MPRVRLLHLRPLEAAERISALVDYKVAAIDETWIGLLFTRRKAT